MRKKIFVPAVVLAAIMLAGCSSSSSGTDAEKAMEEKKAVSDAAGDASVLGNATGEYNSEDNLVYLDYLPSEYVTLGDLSALSVNKIKSVTELSEEEKQSAVEEYLDGHSVQEEIKDRPSAEGDYVAVKYKESQDGQVINDFTDEETEILLGESGEALFEEELLGKSAGDKVSATVPMENEEGDGTIDMVYDVEVVRVYTYKIPELTDEFAQKEEGVNTAKELEEQIYKEALESINEEYESRLWEDLLVALQENCTFNGYPQSLYDESYELADAGYQMFGMGLSEFYGGDEETIKEVVLEYVHEQLAIEAVAEAEKVIVTQEELDKYKQTILEDGGYESMESLMEDYSDKELINTLLSEKVSRLLAERAHVTEITADEYDNLSGDMSELSDVEEEASDDVEELTESELDALFGDDVSEVGQELEDAEETE